MAWYDEEEQDQGLPGVIPPELLALVAKQRAEDEASQVTRDAATVEQLKGLDESSRKNANASLIAQGFDNATAGFLRRAPARLEVPKVDENVRTFLAQKAQRKPPGPLDDLVKMAQAARALRPPAERPVKPGEEPPDAALIKAAQDLRIDPTPYRTRGELLRAMEGVLSSGRQATNQAVAAERTEEARARGEERKAEATVAREATKAVGDLDTAVEEADAVIAEVKKNPAAFYSTAKIGDFLGNGLVGKVATRVQANNRDPKDTATRAVVLQRAYKLKNQLAGAAVSASEKSSIEEFNPSENDTAEQIIAKIEGMKRLAQIMREAKAKRHGMPPAAPAAPAGAPVRKFKRGPDGKLTEVKP